MDQVPPRDRAPLDQPAGLVREPEYRFAPTNSISEEAVQRFLAAWMTYLIERANHPQEESRRG